MNIISAIAETFNFLILHFCALVHNFLQVNFTVVSFIIKLFECLKGTLLLNIFSFLNILKCYYQDFIVFLHEVISVAQFVINVTFNFSYKIYSKIIYFVLVIQELIYIIQQNILSFYMFIQFCVLQVYEIISYLTQLIFTSSLLILQLGPNLLIFLSEVIIFCLCYISTVVKVFAIALVDNLCNACYNSREALFGIPVKAYFGALLFIALYYQREKVCVYTKEYFAHLTFFIIHSGILVSTYLKSVFNILTYIITKVKLFLLPEKTNICSGNIENSRLERNSDPLQRNFLHKHFLEIKEFFKKILPFNNHHIDEQIKQLQNELTAEREKHICIICFDKPRSVIFYPCRHMCVCDECSTNLGACPLCRSSVFEVYHVFT